MNSSGEITEYQCESCLHLYNQSWLKAYIKKCIVNMIRDTKRVGKIAQYKKSKIHRISMCYQWNGMELRVKSIWEWKLRLLRADSVDEYTYLSSMEIWIRIPKTYIQSQLWLELSCNMLMWYTGEYLGLASHQLSYRYSDRPCLKSQRWRILDQVTLYPPVYTHTHTPPTHTHTIYTKNAKLSLGMNLMNAIKSKFSKFRDIEDPWFRARKVVPNSLSPQ